MWRCLEIVLSSIAWCRVCTGIRRRGIGRRPRTGTLSREREQAGRERERQSVERHKSEQKKRKRLARTPSLPTHLQARRRGDTERDLCEASRLVTSGPAREAHARTPLPPFSTTHGDAARGRRRARRAVPRFHVWCVVRRAKARGLATKVLAGPALQARLGRKRGAHPAPERAEKEAVLG
jgi:hypothetical protein